MKIPGKIIQIVAEPETSDGYAVLYALTDEGKVYAAINNEARFSELTWDEVSRELAEGESG